jgi:hypothetical protein
MIRLGDAAGCREQHDDGQDQPQGNGSDSQQKPAAWDLDRLLHGVGAPPSVAAQRAASMHGSPS